MLRLRTITPVAVVALALAAPGAAAAPSQDLRSPDSVDGHRTAPAASQDLRSPDSIDGHRTAAAAKVERVSPDARYGVPEPGAAPPVVTIRQTRVVEVPRSGFAWGDAAIGGGAMLALVLAATGIVLTVRPRRSVASAG